MPKLPNKNNRPVNILGDATKKIETIIENVKQLWDKLTAVITKTDSMYKYLDENIQLPDVETAIKKYSTHNNLQNLYGTDPFYHSNQPILTTSDVAFNKVTSTTLVTGATGKFGNATNYSEFESDGTLKFNGDATVWNDVNWSVQSLTTAGATVMDVITVGSNNFRGFTGAGVIAQQADGSVEILHDYKEGSDVVPHLHWMPTSTGAGNVKVSLGYRWYNRGEAMSSETIISFTVAAGGVQYQSFRSDFGTISGSGKTMGGRFVFRIFRDPADAADTYADPIIVTDFGLHYLKDSIGSREVGTK